MLSFITGNKNKFAEMQAVFPHIQQLDIDLPEIQELDPKRIIEEKLKEALKHHKGELIVEDTSLCLDAMNGLPGTFIKWFLQTMGGEKLHAIATSFGIFGAQAKTWIGYANEAGEIRFFEGVVEGEVVARSSGEGFGWDPFFRPNGSELSFAAMGKEEKNKISMRRFAAEKLKTYLNAQTSV